MLFSSWLRKGKRAAPAPRRRTQKSPRQRASFRPWLEALEDRTLLSNYTASTVSQLITDIKAADRLGGSSTITLVANKTFNLTTSNNNTNGVNGLPVIGGTKAVNLTIVGNGDTIQRVAGPNSYDFRLFDVAKGASLTLDHVKLQGGFVDGSDGGAIYNQGTLHLNNSTLSGNNAVFSAYVGGGYGGAIYNLGGKVTVSNSTLSNNSGDGAGGILNQSGTVTVSNGSILSGNTGGALSNDSGTLTISHSTLSDNSASSGGGISNDAGTLTISYSTLSGNSAYYGGGIYINDGTASVNSCTLTGNTAKTGVSGTTYGSNTYGGEGGGIYNYTGTLTVNNSTFANNSPDNIDGPYSGSGNTGL